MIKQLIKLMDSRGLHLQTRKSKELVELLASIPLAEWAYIEGHLLREGRSYCTKYKASHCYVNIVVDGIAVNICVWGAVEKSRALFLRSSQAARLSLYLLGVCTRDLEREDRERRHDEALDVEYVEYYPDLEAQEQEPTDWDEELEPGSIFEPGELAC